MSDQAPKVELVPAPAAENSVAQRKTPLGRPFPRGVSGNPGGKSREEEAVRRWCRKKGLEAVKVLYEIMQADSNSAKTRVLAACALLDRGFGRPSGDVGGSGGVRAAIGVIILPPEGNHEG